MPSQSEALPAVGHGQRERGVPYCRPKSCTSPILGAPRPAASPPSHGAPQCGSKAWAWLCLHGPQRTSLSDEVHREPWGAWGLPACSQEAARGSAVGRKSVCRTPGFCPDSSTLGLGWWSGNPRDAGEQARVGVSFWGVRGQGAPGEKPGQELLLLWWFRGACLRVEHQHGPRALS